MVQGMLWKLCSPAQITPFLCSCINRISVIFLEPFQILKIAHRLKLYYVIWGSHSSDWRCCLLEWCHSLVSRYPSTNLHDVTSQMTEFFLSSIFVDPRMRITMLNWHSKCCVKETSMNCFWYKHVAVFGFFNKLIGHFFPPHFFFFFFWGGFRPAEGFPLKKNQELEILVLWKQV